ncbi:MAG TPA: hypothetical protein VF970_03575 [Gemmatimonadales bacterium]
MPATPVGHKQLAAGRWFALSPLEQLAHIGSEVDRAIRADGEGRVDRRHHAIDRALELFDMTATDARWRGCRLRELRRAREEFCRLFFSDDVPAGSGESLRAYFLAFALAVRRRA